VWPPNCEPEIYVFEESTLAIGASLTVSPSEIPSGSQIRRGQLTSLSERLIGAAMKAAGSMTTLPRFGKPWLMTDKSSPTG
jgi:hypothetical protein